ncbi:MAG TPA: methyltransferase domain-containing protein [Chloroflexota bacterium]|nr:methyltransferase domain-containing protein [Chloroflexota bacterium]
MRERRGARRSRRPAARTSWDALAQWYDGWVGEGGSQHHQQVAVPAVLRLLELQPGERVLDIGAGQGVLAPFVLRAGAEYLGVEAGPRLAGMARRHHPTAQFVVGDARSLPAIREITAAAFDAVVFLLSLQDMDPLAPVLEGAAWALKSRGRVVVLLTHPAYRVPRQSGWGWDEGRKLVYRRVDRYLTPLPVPMKPFPGRDVRGFTRSFHRPIEEYVNGLGANGLLVDRVAELPGIKLPSVGPSKKADELARREIPLFLAIRARKVAGALPELPSGSDD